MRNSIPRRAALFGAAVVLATGLISTDVLARGGGGGGGGHGGGFGGGGHMGGFGGGHIGGFGGGHMGGFGGARMGGFGARPMTGGAARLGGGTAGVHTRAQVQGGSIAHSRRGVSRDRSGRFGRAYDGGYYGSCWPYDYTYGQYYDYDYCY
jgi:hypothetical protein